MINNAQGSDRTMNQDKIRYMLIMTDPNQRYTVNEVNEFGYFGAIINSWNTSSNVV